MSLTTSRLGRTQRTAVLLAHPHTRRLALALICCAVASAGCASLDPRTQTLSQAQLQALLDKQFPRQERVMELLDVGLSRPSVALVPERNRLATSVDLLATERLSGRAVKRRLGLGRERVASCGRHEIGTASADNH